MPDPEPDPMSDYARTLRTAAGDGAFAALDRLCQAIIGHRLFSCSRFEMDGQGGGTAARIYTSDEANYPTSGLKEVVPNRWTRIVIDRHDTFVANTVEGFSDVFPDHVLIASLGLGSVVNLPVVLSGSLLGTVNILHEAGHFTPDRMAALGQLEVAAQLAFLHPRKGRQAV